MKRILFLLAAISLAAAAGQAAATMPEIQRLDQMIGNKDHYDKAKYDKIGYWKKEAARATTYGARFDAYMKLGEEYTLFRADSAIFYYNRAITVARQQGDTVNILYGQMKKIRPEMIAGFYAEAHDEFRALELTDIPPRLQSDFYECGYRLYSFALNSMEEGSQFFDRYSKNTQEFRKRWIASLPADSRLRLLYEAEQAMSEGKNNVAKLMLAGLIDSGLEEDTNEFAIATAFIAKIFKAEGKKSESMKYFALSSISDIQCSVKENQSIYDLSMALYENGDIDRAYRYIFSTIEDAAFCNAQMRVFNASIVLPVIEGAQRERLNSHERMLMTYFIVSVLLLVGLIITIFFLMKQMKKLSRARLKLKEANLTKDEYMGQFLELCSIYMKRLDSFTKTVNRKLTSGQADDLLKMIKSQKFSDEQHGKFYKEFDNAFLKIYTTFVDDMNSLLRPEERFAIDAPATLNTELRIYALYRLGIEDSSKIAEFLCYSVNTIYAYRNKMKNKAIDREHFEEDVLKIGLID